MSAGADDRETLFEVEHRTVAAVSGPLLVVDRAEGVGYDDLVEVVAPGGDLRLARVLELDGERAVVQVLAGTRGLDRRETTVRTRGRRARLGVGTDLVGRTLDGSGRPADGGPPPLPDAYVDVNGQPMNPVARDRPAEFIETGISAIDGLNTLVRGQKLPIFSGSGLPAMELAAGIAAHARVAARAGDDQPFVVVFVAMGVTAARRRFSAEASMRPARSNARCCS
jgi:V/A-type H+-transporting ATPase subunit B